MKTMLVSVCLAALAATVLAGAPPMPNTPAAVDEVLYARPFVLNEGFRFDWCKQPFQVSQGTILVLKVKPELVVPRETAEPLLYVGNQTAMRLNAGNESGCIIVIVPGEVDLTKDPIWFGTPEVAERVDANRVAAEREKAEKAGIKPVTAEKAQVAKDKGGTRVNAADMSALLRDTLAGLVEQYSPQEKRLSEAWRVPPLQPAGKP